MADARRLRDALFRAALARTRGQDPAPDDLRGPAGRGAARGVGR
nr:hypothetical protein [Streptomyces cinnamoneus]